MYVAIIFVLVPSCCAGKKLEKSKRFKANAWIRNVTQSELMLYVCYSFIARGSDDNLLYYQSGIMRKPFSQWTYMYNFNKMCHMILNLRQKMVFWVVFRILNFEFTTWFSLLHNHKNHLKIRKFKSMYMSLYLLYAIMQ